jgi:hypothetical protein
LTPVRLGHVRSLARRRPVRAPALDVDAEGRAQNRGDPRLALIKVTILAALDLDEADRTVPDKEQIRPAVLDNLPALGQRAGDNGPLGGV